MIGDFYLSNLKEALVIFTLITFKYLIMKCRNTSRNCNCLVAVDLKTKKAQLRTMNLSTPIDTRWSKKRSKILFLQVLTEKFL